MSEYDLQRCPCGEWFPGQDDVIAHIRKDHLGYLRCLALSCMLWFKPEDLEAWAEHERGHGLIFQEGGVEKVRADQATMLAKLTPFSQAVFEAYILAIDSRALATTR